MKTTSVGLRAHLDQTVTTLATLWRLVRTDGVELHFTDHDVNIPFDGDTYLAATGYSRTAISNNVGLAVGNMDVSGIFSEGGLTEEELRAGMYDYADIYVMSINWADTSQGVLRLRRGKLGEVTSNPQGFYQAELRSLTQLLSQNIVQSYTAECRTDLGSSQCKIPIQPSVLQRSTAVALGEFYRVPTLSLTGVTWSGLGNNMGFENATAGLAKTTVAGWTVLLGNWNIFSSDNGLSPDSGSKFLSGGTSTASVLEQIINIEDIGISLTEVDAGDVEADFSIKRANQTTVLDTGRVIVQFRDVNGAILGTALDTGSEAITPQDTWVTRSFTGTVLPVGTTQIRIQLSTTKVSGSEADTSFDSLSLTLNEVARTNTFQEIYENKIYEVTTAGTTGSGSVLSPENLLQFENDFTDAVWTQVDTVTSNDAISPIGDLTADLIEELSDGHNFFVQEQVEAVTIGDSYTFSVWLKLTGAGEGNKQVTIVLDRSGAGPFESDTVALTLTSSWRRFSVTHVYLNNQTGIRVRLFRGAGNATQVHAWGAFAAKTPPTVTVGDTFVDGTAVLTARDAWTRDARIVDVIDSKTIEIGVTEARAVDGWYDQGGLAFESSKNSGKIQEMKTWTQSNSRIGIFLPFPFPAQPGTKIRVYPGCDKRITTCSNKFTNAINFRGEPFIPGEGEYRSFADVR